MVRTRNTYTGWCHAGGVSLMLGAFLGGGKNSFNEALPVELNGRLDDGPCCLTRT